MKQSWLLFFFLLLVTWLSFYFYFPNFGIYEDDYECVGKTLNYSISDLADNIKHDIVAFSSGRVVSNGLGRAAIFAVGKIGGLPLLYFGGMLIVAGNSFLLYLLLKKRFPQDLAFLSAMMFILFPADTTKAFLVHTYTLQTALTFTLIASLSYISGRRTLSYFIAICSLLSYENAFLPFYLIPFLDRTIWDKKTFKIFIRHGIIVSIIIFADFLLRKVLGETRAVELNLGDAGLKTLKAVFLGPLAIFGATVHAPLKALYFFAQTYPFIIVGFFLIALGLFVFLRGNSFINRTLQQTADKENSDSENHLTIRQGLILGLFLLPVSYLLSFTHYPPLVIIGRGSSVHLGASIGFALLTGTFLFWLNLRAGAKKREILLASLAFYCALIIGHGALIQQDFVQSWQKQKQFWMQTVHLCPDVTEGTVLILENEDSAKQRSMSRWSRENSLMKEILTDFPGAYQKYMGNRPYISTHSWGDMLGFQVLYDIPKTAKLPILYLTDSSWRTQILNDNNSFSWQTKGILEMDTIVHPISLPNTNVIILKEKDGIVSRSDENIIVGTDTLRLKQLPKILQKTVFARSQMFSVMIQPQTNK